jgi:hypothetical protein
MDNYNELNLELKFYNTLSVKYLFKKKCLQHLHGVHSRIEECPESELQLADGKNNILICGSRITSNTIGRAMCVNN